MEEEKLLLEANSAVRPTSHTIFYAQYRDKKDIDIFET
jgi:hypothetical protein